jgi:hypothetical protein
MRANRVHALLMGGQACVFYGAAEFSRVRGVDAFGKLWKRRTVIKLPDGTLCDLLSLPDLVQAKKTQRDKDWPMIRRLVEAHYFQNISKPTSPQIRFLLQELRTPELLIELARDHKELCTKLSANRPLLAEILRGNSTTAESALLAEETTERNLDRQYWVPLRNELEKLRHPV